MLFLYIIQFILILIIAVVIIGLVRIINTVDNNVDELIKSNKDLETYIQHVNKDSKDIYASLKEFVAINRDRYKEFIDKYEHLIKAEKRIINSLDFISDTTKLIKRETIKANTIDADIKEIKQSMYALEQRAKDSTKFEEDVICKHIFSKLNVIIEILNKYQATSKTTTKSKAKNSSSKSKSNNDTEKTEKCDEKLKTAEKCEVSTQDAPTENK